MLRNSGRLGQVPEAVLVVEGDMARVLEGAATLGTRRLGDQEPTVDQDPVALVEERCPVRDPLQQLHRLDHADGITVELEARVVGVDDDDVARIGVHDWRGRVGHAVSAPPGLCRWLHARRQHADVRVVEADGLFLDLSIGRPLRGGCSCGARAASRDSDRCDGTAQPGRACVIRSWSSRTSSALS